MNDTDFHMISKLMKTFRPAKMHFIDASEEALVHSTLQLDARSDIELQNVRDMSVMLYSRQAESTRDDAAVMKIMDAMSAVTAVIDKEKAKRGLPV